MSELFLRGRRVVFVIDHKDTLKTRHRESLIKARRDFLLLTPGFSLLAIVISIRLSNWSLAGNKFVLNSKFFKESCCLFFGNFAFCFACGGFYYCRILGKACEIYEEEVKCGNISSHEIQMVEDRDYFKSNMCLKYE